MLTKKQKKIYDIIKEIADDMGYFPSVREIGEAAGLSSPATVHAYLEKLSSVGVIRKLNRSWEIIKNKFSIPIMGIVPAGSPFEIFESIGEEIELPEWISNKSGDLIAFRVQGDSMKDAYISEGDIVVIKKTPDAESGDMVIAYLNDSEITLKRLKKDKNKIWLIPDNPDYKPIYDPFSLIGKVIGVLRKY